MSHSSAHRRRHPAIAAPSVEVVTALPAIPTFRRSPLNDVPVLIPGGGQGKRMGGDIVTVPVVVDGQASNERMKPLNRITRHRPSLPHLSALASLGRELWTAGVDPALVHLIAGRHKVAAFGVHTHGVVDTLRHHARRDEVIPTALALAEAFGLHVTLGERGVVEPHVPHEPGGIGKAIRFAMDALDHLIHHPTPSLVVLPDDLVTDKEGQVRDWTTLIQTARGRDSSVLTRVIPANEAAGKYGVVWCDPNGKVVAAKEKPSIDEINLISARVGSDPSTVRVVTGWAVSGSMYPHFGKGPSGEIDITSGIIGKLLAHEDDPSQPAVWAVDSVSDVEARHDLGHSAGLARMQAVADNNHHPHQVVSWMLRPQDGGGRALDPMLAWAEEIGIEVPTRFGERLRSVAPHFFEGDLAHRDPHSSDADVRALNQLAGLSRG